MKENTNQIIKQAQEEFYDRFTRKDLNIKTMRDDRFMEHGTRAEEVWEFINQAITQAVEEAVRREREVIIGAVGEEGKFYQKEWDADNEMYFYKPRRVVQIIENTSALPEILDKLTK